MAKRSFWSGFLCVFIGIILGMVLTLGGIGLTGYLIYKNTKLGTINKLAGTEIVGETTVGDTEINLAGMSLQQLFKQAGSIKNSASKMTVGNVEELFPVINLSGVIPAQYLSADKKSLRFSVAGEISYEISLTELRTKTFKQAMELILDTAKEQTTFAVLGMLGFNFEDFPFVAGEDAAGNPVYTYVELGADGIDPWYAQRATSLYYYSEGEYLPATPGMINGGRGDGATCLYYKAQGFIDMPVVDGVNAMIAELDQEKLTIARLDEMLSLGLKDEQGKYGHMILELLAEKKIYEIEDSFDEMMDELILADFFELKPGDLLYELQYLRYTDATAALHNEKPENADRQVSPGDYVLDEDGYMIEASLNEFVKSAEYAKIKHLVSAGNSKVLNAIGEYTIKELSRDGENIVNTLTLTDVIEMGEADAALNALKWLRFTESTAAAFNTAHGLSGDNRMQAGDKVPLLKEGELYEPAAQHEYVLCTLKDLAANVNNVPLGDLLGVTPSSERILQALKDTTLNSVNARISTLTLSEVIAVEEDPSAQGYSKILVSLKDAQVVKLGEEVEKLALQDVVDISEDSSKVLKTLATTKISAIPEKMDSLKLKDVIEITPESSKVLHSLENTPIKEIGTAIDTMPLGDMVEYDETKDDLFDKLMRTMKNSTLLTMGEDMNHVKLTDLFDVDTTGPAGVPDGQADGVWHFLLEGVPEEEQTLGNIESLITNTADNISASTIRKLDDEGIISLPAETPENKALFDMQLNTLLVSLSNNWSAVSAVLGAIAP